MHPMLNAKTRTRPAPLRWMGWLARAMCMLGLPLVTVSGHAAGQSVRNIVLVHGAFADGSSWAPVLALLQRKGYHVTAVQNPLTSLADDVAVTRRVLARQHGDVILVGHSWAGAVVTEAGNAPNVKGIVYISALVPDSGESVNALLARLHAPMEGMQPDQDGLIWLNDPAAYRQVMAGDVPAAQAKLLASVAPPIAASAFEGKIAHAAWHDKPSWYLITEGDHALPTSVQRRMAEQIGAHSVTLASSHMSLRSHPAEVARLIERTADAAGR